MSEGKSILVDTTKCTACRGCQVACKQWNGLPGTKTRQVGTYQNPQDLSAQTWKVVRFADGRKEDGKPYWNFFPDQCRHCIDPPCLDTIAGYVDGGGTKDEATGAILYTPKAKEAPFEEVKNSCPFNIPRQDEKTKGLAKCTMCYDRAGARMPPACVQTCPTGAMVFGDRKEILALVEKRVQELKTRYPKAMALKPDEVRVIYIVADDATKYWTHAAG